MKLDTAAITVGERFRKELKNIDKLAASIKAVGQLQPILIDRSYSLISGLRRLEACKLLAISVECFILDTLDEAVMRLMAERDENVEREDPLPSENVALAKRLEAMLKPAAHERKVANLNRGVSRSAEDGTSGEQGENGQKGKTRDAVSGAVGMGRTSLAQATEVVDTASDPEAPSEVREAAQEAVEEMDATGKVAPAHKKVKAAKEKAAPKPKKPDKPLPPGTEINKIHKKADDALAALINAFDDKLKLDKNKATHHRACESLYRQLFKAWDAWKRSK